MSSLNNLDLRTSPRDVMSGLVILMASQYILLRMHGRIRVGTCSWTDPTMVRDWYPTSIRTAAERLRYYSSMFDTVEVDSSFYGMPTPAMAAAWAERTPPGFTFHIKAFGMLTRHGVRPEQLPPPLRSEHPYEVDKMGRILHPSAALRDEAFVFFGSALEPLREQGKLGMVLMQFPPYFVANEANRRYIEYAAERLAPLAMAVEFRHSSWLEGETAADTLALLSALDAAYVSVDEPRIQAANALPPLAAATSSTAYVRFHGRNAATWNARVVSASERFKYLYSLEELQEWVKPARHLNEQASTTFLMFNNCYGDYAPKNARQMLSLFDASEFEAPAQTDE